MQLFYSLPAQIMIYLAIPVIIVNQYTEFNTFNVVMQVLVYLTIAYNAECLVEGGCDLWAWLSVALPIIYSLMFIFFGNKLGLSATPPSPITSIMPISRKSGTEVVTQGDVIIQNPNEEIVYVDEQGNVLGTVPANSRVEGNGENGVQPAPTSGNNIETYTI